MTVGQLGYVYASLTGTDNGSLNVFTPAAGTIYVVLSIYATIGYVSGGGSTGTVSVGGVNILAGGNGNYSTATGGKLVIDDNVTVAISTSYSAGTHDPPVYIYMSLIQIQ